MSELTDLEICKRIAEIGGVEAHEFRGSIVLSNDYNEVVNSVKSGRYSPERVAKLINGYAYNPLTDDAICFQLMVKYDIRVESFEPTLKDGSDGYEYHCYKQGALNYAKNTLSISKSPNKSICLAIIEAHKDKS